MIHVLAANEYARAALAALALAELSWPANWNRAQTAVWGMRSNFKDYIVSTPHH